MDYSNWSARPMEYPEDLIRIIDRFLFGSLALGASEMSKGFIRALDVTFSSEAQAVVERFGDESFDLRFFDSATSLEEELGNRCSNADPWDCGEYYFCTRSNKANAKGEIENLEEYKKVNRAGIKREATHDVKRRFFELDSVFRHLRNALAHGCFRYIAKDDASMHEKALFVYDLSGSKISAAGLLSVSRLNSWYSDLCTIAGGRL